MKSFVAFMLKETAVVNNNKYVVSGYIRIIQTIIKPVIPLAIVKLVITFYYLCEYLRTDVIDSAIEITQKGKVATANKALDCWSSITKNRYVCYGAIYVSAMSTNWEYRWKYKIIHGDSATSAIYIGIGTMDTSYKPDDLCDGLYYRISSTGEILVGYNSDGKNALHDCYQRDIFGKGDIIEMICTPNERTLEWIINDETTWTLKKMKLKSQVEYFAGCWMDTALDQVKLIYFDCTLKQ